MSQDIKNMQERASKLLLDAQAILLKSDRTAEERASAQAMIADATILEGDIRDLQIISKSQEAFRSFEKSPRPAGVDIVTVTPEARKKQLTEAFRNYARRDWNGMKQEHRDLLTTSDATGGALIPQEFAGVLVEALKFYGPIASKVDQKVTDSNGAPMKYSFVNDTANGGVLLGTQGTSSPAETDPTFVSKIVNVDTVTGGLIKVSFQELEDSAFNLDSWIRDAFAVRLARLLEKAVTLGTDTAGTTLPSQSSGGLLGNAAIGTTTATLAGGIGWTDLVNAYSSLDPAYVANANWVMSSYTRNALVGLKDGFGRPFFTPDPSGEKPMQQLMGYDVILDQAMPNATNAGAFVANATPILFGDLKQSYLLRTDGAASILRLNERYADLLEVGFYLYTRIGGVTKSQSGINPSVVLKLAAS